MAKTKLENAEKKSVLDRAIKGYLVPLLATVKMGFVTKAFNCFKGTGYMGTSGNSIFANSSYNSTTNFYFYNIGTCPV